MNFLRESVLRPPWMRMVAKRECRKGAEEVVLVLGYGRFGERKRFVTLGVED